MQAGFNFKYASHSCSVRAVKAPLIYTKVLMAVGTKIFSHSSHYSKKECIECFKKGNPLLLYLIKEGNFL